MGFHHTLAIVVVSILIGRTLSVAFIYPTMTYMYRQVFGRGSINRGALLPRT